MQQEMNRPPLRRGRETTRRVAAQHDARMAAEVEAADMYDKEHRTRPAANQDELRAATAGTYSPFHELDRECAYDKYPRVNLALFELGRLCERSVSAVDELERNAVAATKSPQRAKVETIYRHLAKDIERKLRELYSAIEDETPAEHPLRNKTFLLDRLSYGHIPRHEGTLVVQQQVDSVLGTLQRIAENNELPPLAIREAALPTRLVVTNPFAVEMKAYWKREQKLHSEKTLRDSIIRVTENAVATLTLTTENYTDFQRQHVEDAETHAELQPVIEAYTRVTDWMRQQLSILERLHTNEDIAAYMASVNFFDVTHGDATTTGMGLLPALDVLKTMDPELYAAFSGVQAGEDVMNPEATVSEYTGNPFQSAMRNTPERLDSMKANYAHNKRELPFGFERVEAFVDNMHDITVAQPDFFTLNNAQLKSIEHKIATAAGMKQGEVPNADSVARFASVVGLSKILPAYALHETLERIEREDREFVMARLRSAGPTEFLQRLRTLPRFMCNDSEVHQIIETRSMTTHQVHVMNNGLLTILMEFDSKKYPVNEYLRAALWKTADDSEVLTREFLDSIGSFNKENVLAILDAHPNISQQQWLKWVEEHDKEWRTNNSTLIAVERRIRGAASTDLLRRLFDTLDFNTQDLVNTQSQFFVVSDVGRIGHMASLTFGHKPPEQPIGLYKKLAEDTQKLKWIADAKTHNTSFFLQLCFNEHTEENPLIDLDAFDEMLSLLPTPLEQTIRQELPVLLEQGIADIYRILSKHTGSDKLQYAQIDNILHGAERYIPDNPIYQKVCAMDPAERFYIWQAGSMRKNNKTQSLYYKRQITPDTPPYIQDTLEIYLPLHTPLNEVLNAPEEQWQPYGSKVEVEDESSASDQSSE